MKLYRILGQIWLTHKNQGDYRELGKVDQLLGAENVMQALVKITKQHEKNYPYSLGMRWGWTACPTVELIKDLG